ncbi:MAG: hypothetical protein U9Q84_01230 [Thermodesulfobacteriota bacterium]|nr:hypothetical protein [Thermodesulfobacteriota bacterium]
MQTYQTVSMFGVECYTDAYIADDNENLYLISLFGRSGTVKAIGAAIIEGRSIGIKETDTVFTRVHTALKVITQNLSDGVCHKALLAPEWFTGDTNRIVIGEDKKRAFHFLAANISTPLKEEWTDALWKSVFTPQPLTGFGYLNGKGLNECYAITMNKTVEEVDKLVLQGITTGELQ